MTSKYAFQDSAVADAAEFLSDPAIGRSTLYVSPTGSGKSFMEARVHREQSGRGPHYTVAPTIEILAGIYRKYAGKDADREQMETEGFWTNKTLLNRARAGTVALPASMTFDEAHHSVDNEHTELWALLGMPPRVGFTATDYRGTPAETRKLREAWPRIVHVLSLRDAVRTDVIAKPSFTVWPLVNDDLIEVKNGEFVVSQVESRFKEALPDLVERVSRFYVNGFWDRPTMLSVTSVKQGKELYDAFGGRNLPVSFVTGETSERERGYAFDKVVKRYELLIQIAVVGEGVDLPLRRLIDCAPTMSPVRFQQRLGRITRPIDRDSGEEAPEYIACCHNLTRHSYLWNGLIPASQLKASQLAWGDPPPAPTRRNMARALGLEGFGKFAPSPIPLAGGLTGTLYSLQTKDGLQQYAIFLCPVGGPDGEPEPLYAVRSNEYTGRTLSFEKPGVGTIEYKEKRFGKWKRVGVEALDGITAVASVKPGQITQAMMDWWRQEKRGAEWFGLDGSITPDARQFTILPILADTRTRIVIPEE